VHAGAFEPGADGGFAAGVGITETKTNSVLTVAALAIKPIGLVPQIKTGALSWPGVKISASGRHRSMTERRLNEVDRGAAVERVAGVGVTHPVWRDLLFESCLFCRCINDTSDL
jgi:hypothetical protein